MSEPTLEPGWFPHDGGKCPVTFSTRVEVLHRSGERSGSYVDLKPYDGRCDAGAWAWGHYGHDGDIIAYRLLDRRTSGQAGVGEEDVEELARVAHRLAIAVCAMPGLDDHRRARVDDVFSALRKIRHEEEKEVHKLIDPNAGYRLISNAEYEALRSSAPPSPSLREALERLKPPFRVDAFNEVLAGKDSFQAMLLRDEEPGVAHIVAQNLSDQDAEDIAFVLNSAAAISAQPDAGMVETLEAALPVLQQAYHDAQVDFEKGYAKEHWPTECRDALNKVRDLLAARQAREG